MQIVLHKLHETIRQRGKDRGNLNEEKNLKYLPELKLELTRKFLSC